jgi:hypothetical protein
VILAKEYAWAIYLIRGAKAQYVGEINAPDQKTALERAQKEFPLSAEQKKRLMARREA